jgi:hypothetical protein
VQVPTGREKQMNQGPWRRENAPLSSRIDLRFCGRPAFKLVMMVNEVQSVTQDKVFDLQNMDNGHKLA